MKPKILFVGPQSGGGMTAVLDSFRAMFPDSMCVCSYTGGSGLRKGLDAARGLWKTWRLLRQYPEISIVHIHSASNASFRRKMMFARLAKRMGRKVILHIHGGGFREFHATDPTVITKALNSADRVICLSESWAAFFRNAGVERISVIPNPAPEPVRIKTDSDGRLHILFLGALYKEKGLWEIVTAAAANKDKWAGRMVFHLAGIGPEESHLRKYIDEHNLSDTVRLEGWVDGASKATLLSMSDVFILPSYVEALPVSILEAMSYGVPVIATPVGSIPEIVHDNENGFLVAPGNSSELAQAIDTLAADPELRASMGASARKLFQPYKPSNIARALQNLYSSL